MEKLLSLAFLLILTGCANPLNDATYRRYTDAGDSAMNRGDYIQAEVAYARAAQNVDWGRLGPAAKSGSLFNLANGLNKGSNFVLCGYFQFSVEGCTRLLLPAADLNRCLNLRFSPSQGLVGSGAIPSHPACSDISATTNHKV